MLLGSLRFGPDLDLWSLGCVAAELFLREPLFQPKGTELPERSLLDAHFAFLGTPSEGHQHERVDEIFAARRELLQQGCATPSSEGASRVAP